MSDDQKSRIERAHFDAFRALLPSLHKADVRRGAPPAPDFLVASVGVGDIGIELTSISTKDREVESLRVQAVGVGQTEYERRGGPPVLASFFWLDTDLRKRWPVRALGPKLAAVVQEHLPAGEDDRVDLGWEELRAAGLDHVLAEVHIARIPNVRTHWTSPSAGYICSEVAVVQRLVTQKESKLPAYRRVCTQIWLLLVAEGVSIARTVDCDALAREKLTSAFDRVFLLDLFGRKFHEFQTQARPATGATDLADGERLEREAQQELAREREKL